MLGFEQQDCAQTLAEALGDYYLANPGLIRGPSLSQQARRFFRCHDVAHVVFGCGTALDDEAAVKIASIFGTTGGLRVLRGYRLHESMEIYKRIPLGSALASIARSVVVVPRTLLRCLRQRSRWPWSDFDPYLGMPLCEIRERFGITVAHPDPEPK
jgi:hypothetical protein